MLSFIRSLFAALKSALAFAWWFVIELATWPLRPFRPRGRSAIPSAPPLRMTGDNGRSPAVRPRAMSSQAPPVQPADSRHAAIVIVWLAARERGHSALPDLSSKVPRPLPQWARTLSSEQARRVIAAGIAQLTAHLAGRQPIDGVPGVAAAHAVMPTAPARKSAPATPTRLEVPTDPQTDGPAPWR